MAFSEPRHLSLEVLQRLDALKSIEKDLDRDGDKLEQLPNVKAVLQAYRTGSLKWHPGLVTYWSEGTQLCQPRPFDWDEFETINAAVKGNRSFWTERVSSL